MKTLYSAFLLILLSFGTACSQSYQVDLGSVQPVPCEFDTTTTVNAYSKVRMYSTVNDQWNGDLDSLLCYSLVQVSGSWRFPTLSVPTNRSVFFEMVLDSALVVDTTTVYMLTSLGYETDIHLGMEMPDSSVSDTIEIAQDLIYDGSEALCFPTQKVVGQKINRLIYEYKSLGASYNLSLYSPSLNPHWDGTTIVPQVTQPQTDYGPNLVRYWHNIYPTADSVSYTDVEPWGNPTDSTLVQYYVDGYSSLHFQDYTALRGALVDGSDSIRHGLEVILGGSMCITFFEVLWEEGNQLVIDGGTIGFHGSTGCNLFGKGGGLKIKTGSRFEYGFNSVGMLALKTGGKLVIEPNAELIINGPVFIYEYYTDPESGQFYMELPVGAKLTFAEGSSLSNQFSKDGTMKLNVYMRGGDIDLSGLTEEEKGLVKLIYDEPSPQAWENLTLYPNPANETLQLLWVAERSGNLLNYDVFDMSGKLIVTQQVITQHAGHNKFQANVDFLDAGIYTMRLMSGNEVLARKKFVKN
ncbi:MAG: T9SS type A sorting domain-containing protein [Flavobacteriales bacterium]|nr:T9SS type A sorting domain-containing protein [Flavobacteriales bacterium]